VIHRELAKKLDIIQSGRWTGHAWEQIELPLYLKNHGNPLLLNLANTAPLFYQRHIVTIHDVAFFKNPSWFSRSFVTYYKYLIPRIAKSALKIITDSEFSKKEIIHYLGIPEEKINVVYSGISKEFTEGSGKEYKNQYGNYILTVASLDPRKNLKNIILAFQKLKMNDLKLISIGSENTIFSDREIKEMIRSTKNMIFTGYVSDDELAGFYKNAKCFVYPSLYEGFGLPPLEAMAYGCPVITSSVASLPEVCGDAAYYVNPYEVDEIAKGIQDVLQQPKLQKELIKKGYRRVPLFRWEESASKLWNVVEEVLLN
jgi:glycosyltransferase involved in cell wall biosynthesis